MSIKAIETKYKGYRFRSRLEARWAVFFDQLGLDWRYEVEGFELDGERYLPDFLLSNKTYFEIKPGPAPESNLPLVYFAGRMGEQLKNFERECYRPFDTFLPELTFRSPLEPKNFLGIPIAYVGPYRTGYGNHCAVHGDCDDYSGAEDDVFLRSMHGIQLCEVFFALIEDKEAFGTLVELGAAKALGKKILVGFSGEIFKQIAQYCDEYDAGVKKQVFLYRQNDLWFAAQAAEETFFGEREDVLKSFRDWLLVKFPMPREQALISRLSMLPNTACAVVYGDPVEAIENDGIVFSVKGKICHFDFGVFDHNPDKVKAAARAARQARFEFGECGAPA